VVKVTELVSEEKFLREHRAWLAYFSEVVPQPEKICTLKLKYQMGRDGEEPSYGEIECAIWKTPEAFPRLVFRFGDSWQNYHLDYHFVGRTLEPEEFRFYVGGSGEPSMWVPKSEMKRFWENAGLLERESAC